MKDNYLHWLVSETPTRWWHDSGDPEELQRGLDLRASGVTTNPVLSFQALSARPDFWRPALQAIADDLAPEDRAETLVKLVVTNAARMFAQIHAQTDGNDGYVCSQVNPTKAADTGVMVAMAKRFHSWAPNITVKLPVTAAGLDAAEEAVAEGIPINGTVSFSVAQVIAVAERCRRGIARAGKAGKRPRPSFCTLMIGRQDDYLRDIARDAKSSVTEADIQQAGLAIVKRAYKIFRERSYETTLIIAALRGSHHMVGLAGGGFIMSIHPKIQAMLLEPGVKREVGIDQPIPEQVINRLSSLSEFTRAYEPEGMRPDEFLAYGLTQRTLTQFSEAGWLLLQSFRG